MRNYCYWRWPHRSEPPVLTSGAWEQLHPLRQLKTCIWRRFLLFLVVALVIRSCNMLRHLYYGGKIVQRGLARESRAGMDHALVSCRVAPPPDSNYFSASDLQRTFKAHKCHRIFCPATLPSFAFEGVSGRYRRRETMIRKLVHVHCTNTSAMPQR